MGELNSKVRNHALTIEERFERIEHLTAGIAEKRKKDRDEYKALWRDTQVQLADLATRTDSIARNVDALATDTRLRFDKVADLQAELAREAREADRRLEARI